MTFRALPVLALTFSALAGGCGTGGEDPAAERDAARQARIAQRVEDAAARADVPRGEKLALQVVRAQERYHRRLGKFTADLSDLEAAYPGACCVRLPYFDQFDDHDITLAAEGQAYELTVSMGLYSRYVRRTGDGRIRFACDENPGDRGCQGGIWRKPMRARRTA